MSSHSEPSTIILYDLPSRQGTSWTPNPWKTRALLNFKNIPYTTHWVEYPDLTANNSALGIPPDPNPMFGPYTSPAITLPASASASASADSGPFSLVHLQDSKLIALELEKRFPSPSARLDSPYLARLEASAPKWQAATRPLWMPLVPRALLNPPSAEYFNRTRREKLGMTLEEYAAREGGEKVWAAAAPGFDEVAGMLGERAGPFFEGDTPGYVDLVFASFLKFWRLLDEEGMYGRLVGAYPAFGTLFEACRPWFEKYD